MQGRVDTMGSSDRTNSSSRVSRGRGSKLCISAWCWAGGIRRLRSAEVSFCSPIQKWKTTRVRLSLTEEARSILSRSNKPDNNKKKNGGIIPKGRRNLVTHERFSLLPLRSQCSVLGWGWLFFFLYFLYFFFLSAQTSCEAGRVLLYFLLLRSSCLQSLIDCGHLIPL